MIEKIKQEYIEIMDKQEKFFILMKQSEHKYGKEFLAAFLATSKAIEKQYLEYKNKNKNIDVFKDVLNIAFHHSMDRVITRREHVDLIIRAYEDFKKNGEWRKRKDIVKRLVKASNSETGIKNRQRFKKK